MIEFIVLGKIPGTEIYITFNWLVVMIVSGLFLYDLRRVISRKQENTDIKKSIAKN
jgi:FtsH-binding integral membrane protein